jgi:hypothetical protein
LTQASRTLRQICSTKNNDLLLQLKQCKVIDNLIKMIESQGEEKGEMIKFYCKLALLELCHIQENQAEIESKVNYWLLKDARVVLNIL